MLFYDTCSLLKKLDEIFHEPFGISNISLMELENIKTSTTKDDETKYRARKILHLLEENKDNFTLIIFKDIFLTEEFKDYEVNNDLKIISCAYHLSKAQSITFVTADLSCKYIASCFLPTFYETEKIKDNYTGFTIVKCNTEEEIENFYSTLNEKKPYLENHYIFVQDQDNEIIDKYIYRDNKLTQLIFPCFNSRLLGKIKPKDAFQMAAMDSMLRNKLTLLRGPAGSGKDYLGLGFLIDRLEKGYISKIIIFCNPVATAGAARLGFYPGDKNTKLLDSQIGNFLISKFGGIQVIEQMIANEQLLLVPMSDCRGMDTSGMNAGIYITEAQNMTIDMMKLFLQRIGEDCVCIVNGDDESQVDMNIYAGSNNGLRRMSEVFRGQDFYGEIKLQTIYRSKIAQIAENM